MSSKKRQPTLASFLNKKVQRVEMLVQTEPVETATASETVNDSGSDNDDTGTVYQGMPSSDDRCDLNCVVSTGEDNQSGNTDRDTDGHDTGSVVDVESETMD